MYLIHWFEHNNKKDYTWQVEKQLDLKDLAIKEMYIDF